MTTAPNNAFFGTFAGFSTVSNGNNSFFGAEAGFNSTGLRNSFFGAAAGNGNTSGNDNVAFGNSAGLTNTTGTNNTILGANADVSTSNLIFASAIGGSAKVSANDTIVLGKVAGTYNSVSRPADTVLIPGNLTVSGTFTAPVQNMKVAQTSAQTLSSTTSFSQVLHFDSVLFGSGPALSSDQILITEAGLYQISSQIEFASNATGYRGLAILVPSHVPAAVLLPAVSGNDTILTTSSLVRLNVNDFVKVEALQNSGGNLATVVNDQGAAFLSVVRVGP